MKTLVTLWEQAERARPDKVAVVAGGRRATYRDVGRRIRNMAEAMRSRWRVSHGDIVALLLPNSLEFVVSYFATVRMGGVCQPLDERLMPEEIHALLSDSRARFLIVHRALWHKIAPIRAKLGSIERILGVEVTADRVESFVQWTAGETKQVRPAGVSPGDVAELMYTSGTTGRPKGAMRTHANVLAASRNARRGFGYRAEDVIAIVMPMSHSSALVSQMMPLIELGGTLVLLERFDPARLLAAIGTERVTCVRAVPAMLRTLLATGEFGGEKLPSLRLLINSSASLDAQTAGDVSRRFRGVAVLNSYGLTEASTCTVLSDGTGLSRPGSIGVPIEGVDMSVRDDSGCAMADGEEGELCVRGDHVFAGYRGRPAETQAAFLDGWLRTGDLGHRDADGQYYLHARKTELINCAGRKVIPWEVERCILEVPDVAEAAVVGMDHGVLGQVVKAFVVPRNGAFLEGKCIIHHCARNLASHKVPFRVELVAELPKNSVGKVLRHTLAERAV